MAVQLNDVHLSYVDPPLGSDNNIFMLESFTVNVGIQSSFPVQLLRPQLWTNATHKQNPEGKWHGLELNFIKKDEHAVAHFQTSFLATSHGSYEYTIRIALRKLTKEHTRSKSNNNLVGLTFNAPFEEPEWKWASGYGQNGKLHVAPPNENMPWTKGPQTTEVIPNLSIGNFIAASQAQELGFNAVLNMASEVDVVVPPSIKYKKIPISDGANNAFTEEDVKEAVRWIDQRLSQNAKVLVHCRAGIGRSGSIAIAYLYYSHPEWSYEQTLEAIWKVKADIYPHKELESSLQKLFPRKDGNGYSATTHKLRSSTTG